MKGKTLLKQYGVLFLGVFVIAFFMLVTLNNKHDLPTFPGDIMIKQGKIIIYLPFTSSAAFSFFVIAMKEMYTFVKRL